jgi:hypothetical protein
MQSRSGKPLRRGLPICERKDQNLSEGSRRPVSQDERQDEPLRADHGYAALALPKERRQRDHQHLRFVAKQPCLVCGRQPCDPIIFGLPSPAGSDKRSATSSQYRSAAPITASSRAPEKNSIGGRD